MRTRSQQQSPGGFVSLENTRRTRSTRSVSQTNAATTANATVGRSDPVPTEASSGPSKEPATRAKAQRATTKSTAAATRKKITKPAPKKAPAKRTRKSTRKTAKATSEEPETHDDATPETTPESDENKENLDEAAQNTESEIVTAEQALTEQDNAQRESIFPIFPQPGARMTPDALHPFLTPAPTAFTVPSSPSSTSSPRALNASTNAISGLSPVGTIGASWTDPVFGDISDIGSPLSERSRTPSLDEPLFADGEIDEFLFEQLRGAGQCGRSTEDFTWEQPAAPSAFESPAVAEPTAAESTESVAVKDSDQEISQSSEADSLSTSAVGSGGAGFEQVDDLTQLLAAQNLADLGPAAVVSPWLPSGPTWQPETARSARDPSSVSLAVGSGSSHYFASQAAIPSPIPEKSESETSPGPGASEVAARAPLSSVVSQALMVSHDTHSLMADPDRPSVSNKLMHTAVNRKRTHSVLSDDETAAGGPQTPIANKRRNLGAPGSTPFTRRLPPLSRRLSSTSVPYSERLRRRQEERQGRIHRTIYRLPEYIAQEVADRQAVETTGQQSPCPEPPLADVDTPEEPEQAQENQDQDQPVEDAPAEPTPKLPSGISSSFPSALPETPRRGWNIRGLLNSVPRSFSRFIPRFRRSSAQSTRPDQSLTSSNTETTGDPANERYDGLIEDHPAYIAARAKFRPLEPRRRLTVEPPPRPRLDYSLFPRPMDMSLYIDDIATPLRNRPDPSSLQSASLQSETVTKLPDAQNTTTTTTSTSASAAPMEGTPSASQDQDTRGRETLQQASSNKQKKRKREPSPDVIPNPPGCSYGMDTDYFWYSSESEDESDTRAPGPSTAPQQTEGLATTAVRSALRSDRPASKKVRFDASPEDTPSKLRTRARATDPYTGSHFIGMDGGSSSSSFVPPSPTPTAPTPTAPTPASSMPISSIREEDLYGPSPVADPRTRPGFIPNTQGTFQLDYDAFSDDSSESSGPPSPTSVAAPSPWTAAEAQPNESIQSPTPPAAPSPAPLPTPVMPPPTPAAPVDDEALAKVRSLAEKHKPKTPSRLRTASRYSSPLTITPDARVPIQDSVPIEHFGNDEFARDAQWLYERCPSGDLTQFQWPDRQGYQESLGISQTAIDVIAEVWDDSEVDEAYNLFCQGFEEFRQKA